MTRFDAYWFLCRSLCLTAGDLLPQRLRQQVLADEVDWPQVVELASQHLVCPALHRAFLCKRVEKVLPEDVRDYFSTIHTVNKARNRRLQAHAVEVVRALNGIGVAPMLLKGIAGVFLGAYPDPAARVIRDLDVLVPESTVGKCVDRLRESGYDRYHPEHEFPTDHYHYHWLFRQGVPALVEIHRDAVDTRWQSVLPTRALWRESRRLSVEDLEVCVPSSEHRLLHALIHAIEHAVQHHGEAWHTRLPLRDVLEGIWLRAKLDPEANWPAIMDRFEAQGAAEALHTFLYLSRRTLNVALPVGLRSSWRARCAYGRHFAELRFPLLTLPAVVSADLLWQLRCAAEDPALRRRFAGSLLRPTAYGNVARRLHGVWDGERKKEP
jgi:hypothetical protein